MKIKKEPAYAYAEDFTRSQEENKSCAEKNRREKRKKKKEKEKEELTNYKNDNSEE